MAATLKKVLKWIDESELDEHDLSGADLSGASLSADFSDCQGMRAVNLQNARVTQSELNGLDLSGSRFDGAVFSQCNFEDANLSGVSTQGTRFEQCDFSAGVRRTLTGATFKQCSFGGDDESDGGALTAADAGAAPGAPESEWKKYLRGFEEWPEERRYQAIEALLNQLGRGAQPAQVFRRPNDQKVELRGVFQGAPVRVEIDNGGTVSVAMQVPQSVHVSASFSYEPTFVPEPQVAAWNHGDTVRVFIGKGVFIEGHAGTTYVAQGIESTGNIDRMTALVSRLGTAMVEEVAAGMIRENLMWMQVEPQLTNACVRSEVHQMYDPLTSIWNILGFFARVAQAFQAVTANDAVALHQTPLASLSLACRYCRALHVVSQSGRCPNCGAPSGT